MMFQSSAAAFALSLLAASGFGQTLMSPKIEDALAAGKTKQKPVMLEFYATWCPPCRLFERDILPDAGVQKKLGGFIFARYDSETDAGWPVHQKYLIRNWPTFITLDKDGNEKDRYLGGFNTPADFTAFLDKELVAAGAAKTDLAETPETLSGRLERASKRGDSAEAEKLFAAVKRVDSENKKDLLAKAMYQISELKRGQGKFNEAAGLLERIAETYPDSSAAEGAAYMLEIDQRRGALERTIAFYKKMIAAHPQKIYWYAAFAELSAVNRYRLAEGFAMANKAISLDPKNSDHYEALAKLYHVKNDLPNAVEAMKKAAAAEPASVEYKEKLARYEAELAAIRH